MRALYDMIQSQDSEKGDALVKAQAELNGLKKAISVRSKKNYTLEQDIRVLDKKIALLIRKRISINDIQPKEGEISLVNVSSSLKTKKEKENYGKLFYILQKDTHYTAKLARLIPLAEIDNLLQTVMFSIYGNHYDEMEEHLLLSMFRQVLDDEFADATGLGSLLRANTALTRMMTTYTRRGPGQTYLKKTLADIMGELTKDKTMNLEINPLKVYMEYIDDFEIRTGQKSDWDRQVQAEEAAEKQEVKDIIAPRVKILTEISAKFIDCLISSVDDIPYGIRWICKQIRDLVIKKFPDATEEQMCSLIGGFYLLRFVNPAVVTPQAFMLVDTKLPATTRRNLTIMAKILQNLANNVRFGGLKEFYMEPLNGILDENKVKLNSFLLDMTKVGDLEQHLRLDRYMSLARTGEHVIDISANEIFFLHGLLQKHMDTIEKEDDDVARILSVLGSAPEKLGRKDNFNIELKLLDPNAAGGAPGKELSPEQLYDEAKYLLFYILKNLPLEELEGLKSSKIGVNKAVMTAKKHAQETKNKALLDRCKRFAKNVKLLMKRGHMAEGDNYSQLRKDAFLEMQNYDEQTERVKSELEKLNYVMSLIEEQTEFLAAQFEAYGMYLEDVRAKCSLDPMEAKKRAKAEAKALKKERSNLKAQKIGPFKYSYNQLEKEGVILESEVPKERRGAIHFLFSSLGTSEIDVAVMWRIKKAMEVKLDIEELKSMKADGKTGYETDLIVLDINLLLHLLLKHFSY